MIIFVESCVSTFPSFVQSVSHLPNKLFVGCLPLKPEVSNIELTEYFSQYGRLTDVYIPRPYRCVCLE